MCSTMYLLWYPLTLTFKSIIVTRYHPVCIPLCIPFPQHHSIIYSVYQTQQRSAMNAWEGKDNIRTRTVSRSMRNTDVQWEHVKCVNTFQVMDQWYKLKKQKWKNKLLPLKMNVIRFGLVTCKCLKRLRYYLNSPRTKHQRRKWQRYFMKFEGTGTISCFYSVSYWVWLSYQIKQ